MSEFPGREETLAIVHGGPKPPGGMVRKPPSLRFSVPGRPRSWKRAGQRGRRKWNPNEGEQQRIAWAAMAAANVGPVKPKWPTDARYEVRIRAYYPHRVRADLDNVAKMVCDALSRVLFADDSQVDRLTVTRHVDRDNPRVEVTVEVLG